jgi:hypothetical protein
MTDSRGFLFGMVALLNWHEAGTKERRMAFRNDGHRGAVVVLVLGNMML